MTAGQKAAAAAVGAVLALGAAGTASAKTHHHHRHGSTSGSGAASEAVAYARAHLGDAYVWGGTGPDGFDCSGLTSMAWRHAGVTIPRTSQEQWLGLRHVGRRDLEPGDLVFSFWPGADSQPSPNHVQMYAGHGYVIGADTTDVERVPLSTDAGHIVGYARPGGA
jgi:cell wall-associated NlpC family hydrolase